VRPLFDSNAVAAGLFWVVFFGWGLLEMGGSAVEMRRMRQRGQGRASEDKGTAPLFVVAIYGGLALAFLAAYEATWASIPSPRWASFGSGLTLIVVGVAGRQWAIHTLGPFFTREVRILRDHALVTAGPYRVVRHPSYAAGQLSDLGLGLALGNWLSIVAAVGPILAVTVRRIGVEEDALRRGLGPGVYEQYASGRARLVPGVW